MRFDAGGGVLGDGSGVDVVAEEDFGTWLTLRDLDLASQLSSFWRNMDIRPDGEVVQSMKESDAESDVGFFRKLKDDLLRRDGLEDGEVTVGALARWCREVVGGRFADTDDFPRLEHLAEYMRLEFRIVQEQAGRVRSSCAMEGEADRLDVDETARQAAELLVGDTAPRAAKTNFSWHKISQEPSGMRAPGRIERAFPLEFPLGIGGLYDDVRDEESTPLRRVPPRVWAQHLFRLWGGTCVHGLRGHRLVWAVTNLVLLQETWGKGYIVQKNSMGRLASRFDPHRHMTKDDLRRVLKDEELCRSFSELVDEGGPECTNDAYAVG